MGAPEEVGKVAGGVVEALKSQPLTLALVLFNIIFLVIVFYATTGQRQIMERLITMMVENQQKTSELLFRCTPTGPQTKTLLPLPYRLDLLKAEAPK